MKFTSTAVETLADAYFDDPVICHILPDPAKRRGPLRLAMRFLVALARFGGDFSVVDEGRRGALVFFGPGKFPVSKLKLALPLLRNALPALLSGVTPGTVVKALKLLTFLEPLHPKEPHYFVLIVGVGPKSQGRGEGSLLMKPLLERADHDGATIYLESSNQKNIPFYERLGFRVVNEIKPFGDGPSMWRMSRASSGQVLANP